VSDLARNAVQRLIADGNRDRENQSIAPKVEMLEKLIIELNSQLQFLTTLLQRQNGLTDSSKGAGE